MYEYAYDLTGSTYGMIREFDIAAATVIKKGEPVSITAGKIVSAGASPTSVVGIAAEPHDGSSDARQKGTKIRVYASPTAVFKTRAPKITATGGSTTTFVSTALGTPANDAFKAGYIKVKSAGNTSLVNQVAEVTGSATTTGTLTVGTQAAALQAGDVAMIFPPFASTGWKNDATAKNDIDLNTTGGTAIIVVDIDTDKEDIYIRFKNQLTL